MREIKFRAWSKRGLRFWYFDYTKGFNSENSDCFTDPMQYTGLADKNGVEIYEGDVLNICFTSGGGEYVHDGVYVASKNILGGLQFEFKRLLWESFGHNQFPLSSTLCEKYHSLSTIHDNDRVYLIAGTEEGYVENPMKDYPFNNEEILSFASRYFEVIGSIQENPEIIEDNNEN